MKILISGSKGQLGNELQLMLAAGESEIGPLPQQVQGAEVACYDIDTLDITDLTAVSDVMRIEEPDVVINCSAFTNVDGCERETDAAFRANAIGPRNLAMACTETGAKLIHVSTDYVFSGAPNGEVPLDETAQPAPVSAYGKTKLLGEEYVRAQCPRSFVVRTAWLYSKFGKNFVFTMMNAGKKLGALTVVDDQLGNPTYAVDLAHHLLKLAVSEQYGTYHCTNNGVCSWYDFTQEIMHLSGTAATVTPCTSDEYAAAHPEAARRPAWSALENRMLRCTVGDEMRSWQNALQSFFAHYKPEE